MLKIHSRYIRALAQYMPEKIFKKAKVWSKKTKEKRWDKKNSGYLSNTAYGEECGKSKQMLELCVIQSWKWPEHIILEGYMVYWAVS